MAGFMIGWLKLIGDASNAEEGRGRKSAEGAGEGKGEEMEGRRRKGEEGTEGRQPAGMTLLDMPRTSMLTDLQLPCAKLLHHNHLLTDHYRQNFSLQIMIGRMLTCTRYLLLLTSHAPNKGRGHYIDYVKSRFG